MNETLSVVRSAKTVSKCIATSRLLGFVRMMLMSHFFGTSIFVSAFFLAFQIPNMFRRLFGEGALSAAFVPVFAESIERDGIEEANKLASKVITMLASALLLILAGGFIMIALWKKCFSPAEDWLIAMPLMNIMLPYMFFICMVALFMGILNSRHHFFVPAAAPILLNVVWIVSVLFLCPVFGSNVEQQIRILAWSILAAGLVQLLVHVPMVLKYGIRLHADFAWRDARVHKILLLMGPGVLGMGLFQINALIGKFMAHAVAPWAVSSLMYSELMVYLPLGIFATALGTVLLPTFSGQAARDDHKSMLQTMNVSLRGLMFVMLPAAVGLGVMAKPIIELIYEHGEFGSESTMHTARALWFLAPGLIVFSLYKVFVPVFYSRKDTKTPAVVALIAVALNFLLMVLFVIVWPAAYKHAGIAFASVLSSTFSCVVLGVLINKQIGNPGWAEIALSFGKSFVIALLMGGCVWFVISRPINGSLVTKTLRVAGGVAVGLCVYFSFALIFCKNELRILRNK